MNLTVSTSEKNVFKKIRDIRDKNVLLD